MGKIRTVLRARRYARVLRRFGPLGLGVYVAWRHRRALRQHLGLIRTYIKARALSGEHELTDMFGMLGEVDARITPEHVAERYQSLMDRLREEGAPAHIVEHYQRFVDDRIRRFAPEHAEEGREDRPS